MLSDDAPAAGVPPTAGLRPFDRMVRRVLNGAFVAIVFGDLAFAGSTMDGG